MACSGNGRTPGRPGPAVNAPLVFDPGHGRRLARTCPVCCRRFMSQSSTSLSQAASCRSHGMVYRHPSPRGRSYRLAGRFGLHLQTKRRSGHQRTLRVRQVQGRRIVGPRDLRQDHVALRFRPPGVCRRPARLALPCLRAFSQAVGRFLPVGNGGGYLRLTGRALVTRMRRCRGKPSFLPHPPFLVSGRTRSAPGRRSGTRWRCKPKRLSLEAARLGFARFTAFARGISGKKRTRRERPL